MFISKWFRKGVKKCVEREESAKIETVTEQKKKN